MVILLVLIIFEIQSNSKISNLIINNNVII